jgi:hypothetical protein
MRYLRGLKLFLTEVTIVLVFLGMSTAIATSANVSHPYKTKTNIPNGSIVSLDPNTLDNIVLANTDNGTRIIGVALASKDSLLAVNPSGGTVQVAINGTVNTLVSNVNGDIKVGDQVSVSPFDGIGMESSQGTHVIGVAQTAFNSKSAGVTTETVKDKTGKTQQIDLGYIRLSIAIGTAGNGSTGGGQSVNFLQRLIKSLTGHTISTIRILLSIIVTVMSIITLITLIYASIYGSLISIGRNPLAQGVVLRALGAVMIMAILTISVTSVAVYYLLH